MFQIEIPLRCIVEDFRTGNIREQQKVIDGIPEDAILVDAKIDGHGPISSFGKLCLTFRDPDDPGPKYITVQTTDAATFETEVVMPAEKEPGDG